MTKRLSTGALLVVSAVLFTAMSSMAAYKTGREWTGTEDPYVAGLPLFFRSQAGTTWVEVGQACDASDSLNSTHSPSQVWCFEGAGGDSSWPANAGGTLGRAGSKWDHWSKFDPPLPPSSKWFVTNLNPSPTGGAGNLNAWCGCDSVGANPGCTDTAFWLNKEGYGDDWNYGLTLSMTGQNNTAGGTLEFDIRYDCECNYDYMYLEYKDGSGAWQLMDDGSGGLAVFNGVSGNLSASADTSRVGRDCGNDIFGHSDQAEVGGFTIEYHGNSTWVTDVVFPIPAAASGGAEVRWRGFSDGAWSDQDNRGDTDGLGAIDNVLVTFTATGATVSDNFNASTGPTDFTTSITSTTGSPFWIAGGLEGSPYDGWHLTFDPNYKNKGNTCTFSNDWMWSSKPDAGNIPGKGFSYFLASPVVNCSGWSGGAMEYSNYLCAPDARNDYQNTHVRVYDSNEGWSPWNDFDGYVIFGGCEFWNMNSTEDLTPFLGATVDSLQMGYEFLDTCSAADFCWGRHLNSIWTIDQVSIGSFNGEATVFTTRAIDLFADTFSRRDPAHTPQLPNSDQGQWPGRVFLTADSLQVTINDFNGVTAGNVLLHYRVGTGSPPAYGAYTSKAMNFSNPDALSPTDEGDYRTVIGNGTTEDFGAGADIWNAGTSVEYYITCLDDAANTAYFPNGVDTGAAAFRFQVLPLGRTLNGAGEKLLLVDDYTRNDLDFENSVGFQPSGGAGFGSFTAAAFDQPEDMVERALAKIYGGGEDGLATGPADAPKWDIYNVQGAGSSVQCEPRIIANSTLGIGGVAGDLGTPNYDALIWLNGTFDAYSIADTSRIELKSYMNNGGNLLSFGQDIAKFLSGQNQGQDADSAIFFLQEYLGTEYLADETSTRVLNISGATGTSLDGLIFGLYGECNGLRKAFDQLELASSLPVGHTNEVLASYSDGGAGDTTAAVVKLSIAGAGNGIQVGFPVASFLSDDARACFLNAMLVGEFGMTDMSYTGCENTGVGAPDVAASRFGFDLAAASPNPFVDVTSIRFSVPSRTHVSIEVYNILGQKVRTLVDESRDAASYVERWDGRSDAGATVSSGIYFYKMVAGEFSDTKKAVLLK
ncbi:MAG: hypothetical protein DHS20C21_07020 [Gemmatimonadota bacterium]|nr:MAG: hypothetical protein DHS20C21_07020 [Gemmatimonadota bacterium]